MKTSGLIRLLPAVLVTLSLGCGTLEPISIGVVGSFSDPEGQGVLWAAQSAVNAVNATGGIAGRTLQLVVEDDSTNPETAILAAQRLYDDASVVAVIGHMTRREALAAAPVYTIGSTPLVAVIPSASQDDLAAIGPYIFQISPGDSDHGTALAKWAYSQQRARAAAILYQNNDYGRSVRSGFITEFESQGGTVVADWPYLAELPSVEPFLRALGRVEADVLLISGDDATARRIIATLDSVGVQIPVIGPEALMGLRYNPPSHPEIFISSAYQPDRATPRNQVFVDEFRAANGGELPTNIAAATFDAVQLLTHTVDEVGTDRTAIRDYLASVGQTTASFEGITGTIRFDQHGAAQNKEIGITILTGASVTRADGS